MNSSILVKETQSSWYRNLCLHSRYSALRYFRKKEELRNEHRRFSLFEVRIEEPLQQELSAVSALLIAVHRLW